MKNLYLLFPTLLTLFVSFLIVRSAAIALMMTGLDRKKAIFQAISAFTGTGFTTREAERMINHPQRRKIISWLMILGNAGIVTVIVTATSSFATSGSYNIPINILFLAVGIYLIYRIAVSKGFIERWENFVENRLVKSKMMEEDMVEDLLHLIEGHGLVKVLLKEGSPLIGMSLKEKELTKAGILVLGIEREKNWLAVPKPSEIMEKGDRVIVYGPIERLNENFRGEK